MRNFSLGLFIGALAVTLIFYLVFPSDDSVNEQQAHALDKNLLARNLREQGELSPVTTELTKLQRAYIDADSIKMADDRSRHQEAALRKWATENGNNAAEWVNANRGGTVRSDALVLIAECWALSDPLAAGEWFLENTSGHTQEAALWEVVEEWAKVDAKKSLEFAMNIKGSLQNSVIAAAAPGLTNFDLDLALDTGLNLAEKGNVDFLVAAVSEWSKGNPSEAFEWTKSLPEKSLKSLIATYIGDNWGKSNPESASNYFQSLTSRDDLVGAARFGLSLGWAENDPASALTWVIENISDDRMRMQSIRSIVPTWIETDPMGASSWLVAQDSSNSMDQVFISAAEELFATAPMAARKCIAMVADDDLRNKVLADYEEDIQLLHESE